MSKQSLHPDFFSQGIFDAHEFFGAHVEYDDASEKKIKGVWFRLFAPNASTVSVIGSFNDWNAQAHIMIPQAEYGVYSCFIQEAKPGDHYLYAVTNIYGQQVKKADPYARSGQKRPEFASVITAPLSNRWHDQTYLATRSRGYEAPISIYEVHVGSWKKKLKTDFLSYRQLADELIPYVLNLGYTHIELMPITQHPFDGSWGYQSTGMLAIDSRYGTLEDFQYFVDQCHQHHIGVILDYVVVHFASDPFGLIEFDGGKLYEYFDPQRTYSQWGSPQFDLSSGVARSLLFSGMRYFLETFHIDGLRIDAVSNIVYWDGDSSKGENHGGQSFLRQLNTFVHEHFPSVMMIAEDSTAFPGVTRPATDGGLGFDYKWDMGWMNDTLKFYALDDVYKYYDHDKFSFSMHYFFSERFLLPFSHDEVVHGKGTILNKMWGDYDQKFALLRNLYTYQFTHPGKKLNFMGNELASFDEWDEKKEVPWFFLNYPKHAAIQHFFKQLHVLYKTHESLFKNDYDWQQFRWLMVDNRNDSVFAYERSFQDKKLIIVLNMKGNYYNKYDIRNVAPGFYEEILNTDDRLFGGWNHLNKDVIQSQEGTLSMCLAPYAAIILNKIG